MTEAAGVLVALLALGLAIAAAVAFWPDSGSHPAPPDHQLYVETIEVNGREVECVVYDSNTDAGAVDCEFEEVPR